MDEFALIRQYFDRPPADDSVLLGVGDDGAILQTEPGRNLISVIDTLVEGVHFPQDFNARDLGYRAVAVNLSDIAAMGSRPRWMTLAMTLPRADQRWLDEFASGLFAAASEHRVSLVGGDTTRGERIVITVQINGDVADGTAIRRSGAQVGDIIYVSGGIGDASAGLGILQSGARRSDDDEYLIERFSRPSARVELGLALTGIASAAIDISDGLYADLAKLASASGGGADIRCESVPLSGPLKRQAGDNAIHHALAGGDDYELCFTASPRHAAALEKLSRSIGLPITAIGSIRSTAGVSCTLEGNAFEFESAGYLHF